MPAIAPVRPDGGEARVSQTLDVSRPGLAQSAVTHPCPAHLVSHPPPGRVHGLGPLPWRLICRSVFLPLDALPPWMFSRLASGPPSFSAAPCSPGLRAAMVLSGQ